MKEPAPVTAIDPSRSNPSPSENTVNNKDFIAEAGKMIETFINPQCAACNAKVNVMNFPQKCRMCNLVYCSKCIEQTKFPVPNKLLFQEMTTTTNAETKSNSSYGPGAPKEDKSQYLCKGKCFPQAVKYCMEVFQQNIHNKFGPILSAFLAENCQFHDFYPISSLSAPEDSAFRQTIRIAQVAEVLSAVAGFSLPMKVLKYAFFSTALVYLLVESDMFVVLHPFLENLKSYGIDGPTALLNLYYLSCKHQLLHRQTTHQHAYYPAGRQEGVLMAQCPPEVVDYVARYVSAAQCLYTAALPPPHQTNDWSSWFLAKTFARQQWTLLMCVNETTKLPNGNKAPAFALFARQLPADPPAPTRGRRAAARKPTAAERAAGRKEALLVVRGSASTMDWSINFQESLAPCQYRHYCPAAGQVVTVDGHAHSGFQQAARAILADYGLRDYVLRLFAEGFDVKVVGHSLGAGVSVLLAAELRGAVLAELLAAGKSGPALLETHRVAGVVFCAPAVLSVRLAEAFLRDRLLVNVINGSDAIPRYNRRTMTLLAAELKEFSAVANEWFEEDKMDIADYALSVGKAADIQSLASDQKRRERYERLRAARDKRRLSGPGAGNPLASLLPATPPENPLAALNQAMEAAQRTILAKLEALNRSTFSAGPPLPMATATQADETAEQPSALPADISLPEPTPSEEAAPLKSESSAADGEDSELSVVPGPVVHLFKDGHGLTRAAVIDHRHQFFQRIELLLTDVISEHDMVTYRASIDAVRHCQTARPQPTTTPAEQKPKRGGRQRKQPEPTADPLDELFPSDVRRTLAVAEQPFLLRRGSVAPQFQAPLAATSSTETSARGKKRKREAEDQGQGRDEVGEGETPIEEGESGDLFQRFFRKISKTFRLSTPTLEAWARPAEPSPSKSAARPSQGNQSENNKNDEEEDEEETADRDGETISWLPCSVCGLDVTWPYPLHSDSSRAFATHNCSACGKIVCSLCSPAADQLPGDGISQTVTLPDFRIALPWLGLLSPQRVCLHCYYDSSHPGLAPHII